ncbi:MAG: class I SAM-dependent methyltransferase, partial [Cytophagales bacterium]|nr:class I SAM-dependent methyltransferase [Armatimonadota bacterium]
MGILDVYAKGVPGDQTALDIFKEEWSSRFPEERADIRSGGESPLFDDPRVAWAIEQIGGISGKTVLELGPLEGGHTYQFDRAGAASIVAVEANTRGYLKCLIAKEVLGMPSAHFLCGDFVEYLRVNQMHYDLCFASGVLYHM